MSNAYYVQMEPEEGRGVEEKTVEKVKEHARGDERGRQFYDGTALGQTELLHLQKRLLEMKRRIWAEVKTRLRADVEEDYRQQHSTALDELDLATIQLAKELGFSLIEFKRRELLEIEDALLRIEEGTFGICMDCGETINKRRLQFMPSTSRCTVCQTQTERKRKAIPKV